MNERGGSCFPSQSTLARETGLSIRTIREHIHLLEESGWLSRKPRAGHTDLFAATTPATPADPESDVVTPATDTLTPAGAADEDVKEDVSSEEQALPPLGADARKSNGRNPDPLFDAVALWCCGAADHLQLTENERGRINHAVRQLRDVGATPEDVRSRAKRYRTQWPELGPASPQALLNHWNALAPGRSSTAPPAPAKPAEPESLPAEENLARIRNLAKEIEHAHQVPAFEPIITTRPPGFVAFTSFDPDDD